MLSIIIMQHHRSSHLPCLDLQEGQRIQRGFCSYGGRRLQTIFLSIFSKYTSLRLFVFYYDKTTAHLLFFSSIVARLQVSPYTAAFPDILLSNLVWFQALPEMRPLLQKRYIKHPVINDLFATMLGGVYIIALLIKI